MNELGICEQDMYEQGMNEQEVYGQGISELGRLENLSGDMEKNPYKLKQRTACDYCSFKEICGFDEKQEGNSFRRLPTFSDEELWKKMREKGEKKDGNEVDTGTAEGH